MLRSLACSLLAAFAPFGPFDDPGPQTPEDAGAVYRGDGQDFRLNLSAGSDLNRFLVENAPTRADLVLETLDDAARGQLGVPEGRGLVVASVQVDGPAWEAGVRERDVLLTLNDEPLAEPDDLPRLLKKAGDEPATLTLLRKRKPTTLKVQAQVRVDLGPLEDEAPEFWIGANVGPVAPILRDQLDLPADRGLSVVGLVDDGPAAKSGLKVHDVILALDGEPVADAAGLVGRVGKSAAKPLNFEILRGGEKLALSVTPAKRPPRDETRRYYRISSPPAQNFKYYDVVRPGVVLDRQGLLLDNAWQDMIAGQARPKPDDPGAPDARIDAMAAEIKALREAVESLRKALEAKK
ncbi:PDZ domain-containing protein [Paludisphaera soli]|uniref:PDZ domain-containing protein n=1 Tax=Paludisphaera soli TaxID=2712865 RepID=UPI0013ED1EAC|nr:PDZ domain-containing protein [Paludisphaera soli]